MNINDEKVFDWHRERNKNTRRKEAREGNVFKFHLDILEYEFQHFSFNLSSEGGGRLYPRFFNKVFHNSN